MDNSRIDALVRRISGDTTTPSETPAKTEEYKKPKGYDHVQEENLYGPDEFNFLEAQRLAYLLSIKQKVEGTTGIGRNDRQPNALPDFNKMGGDIGKKASDVLNSVNKQIGQIVQHFSENDNNAAFLRTFAEHMPQITQVFGNSNPALYRSGSHLGTDFGTTRGEAVALPQGKWKIIDAYAGAGDGNINDWTNKGYGNSVLAQNMNTGEKVRVSHLQDVGVKTGDIIDGGAVGSAGNSGHSTAVHTDVEYYDPKGKLGDITKTHYVTGLFQDPKKVLQTPDKRMTTVQSKIDKLNTVLKPIGQVQAAQNTMKPIQQQPRQSMVVQPPKVVAPPNNPWVNQQKTYTAPVQNKPVVQPPKPIVAPPQRPKTQTPNIIQNAINAFSNLFKRK